MSTREVIRPPQPPSRRLPLLVAAVLVALGILAVAVRLDAPGDGTRVTDWQRGGVVVDVDARTDPLGSPGLAEGDVVVAIDGQPLTQPPGMMAAPSAGATLAYQVQRTDEPVPVAIDRPAIGPMLRYGWGNLVFVVTLGLLAGALYVRRPDEPATAPLLVAAGGLFGSTLAVVAGVPALAMAVGGPLLWLYNVNVIGSYAVAWGALLPFSLLLPGPRSLRRGWLIGSALAPPVAMVGVLVLAGWRTDDWMAWFGEVYAGTTVIVAAALLAIGVISGLAYFGSDRADARARLRWVAGGSAVTVVRAWWAGICRASCSATPCCRPARWGCPVCRSSPVSGWRCGSIACSTSSGWPTGRSPTWP